MLKIKELRIKKGYTQDQIVELTGIKKRSFVDYESGKTDIPLTKLQNIANVMNLRISDFVDENVELEINSIPSGAVPYYNLPVSAGHSIFDIEGALKPDGYMLNIPGIRQAEACLPVHGYSMQPEVKEGAYIGVRKISSIDTLNTQHKYLIITRDDRMIKYVRQDFDRSDILWCISNNYPDFFIFKDDVIEIHRVTFVMNPE